MSFVATTATLGRATRLRHLCTAAGVVGAVFPPTPQYCWPLFPQVMDATVQVKRENRTKVGVFKVRGGLTCLHALCQRAPQVRGMIAVMRGNHGQSIALATHWSGLVVTIVMSYGNDVEENTAMRVLGAELLEVGEDFQASRELVDQLTVERGSHFVPSYHGGLAVGVTSYWLKFFEATPLDVVYVLIGTGSSICAVVRTRNTLTLPTRIVDVVSAHVRYYEWSLKSGTVVPAPVSMPLADGLARRMPDANAFEIIRAGINEVIAVAGDEVVQATRLYFSIIHNVAKGAVTAASAGARQQREQITGQRIGLPLTGGNIDHATLARVLAGQPVLP